MILKVNDRSCLKNQAGLVYERAGAALSRAIGEAEFRPEEGRHKYKKSMWKEAGENWFARDG